MLKMKLFYLSPLSGDLAYFTPNISNFIVKIYSFWGGWKCKKAVLYSEL